MLNTKKSKSSRCVNMKKIQSWKKKKKTKEMVFPPRLCLPHSLDSLCHTNVIRLELVQSDGRGDGEDTEEPLAEGPCLGDTLLGKVVDDGCPVECKSPFILSVMYRVGDILEPNVRVENQKRAQSSVGDGVESASSEGGNGQRNKANSHESIKR